MEQKNDNYILARQIRDNTLYKSDDEFETFLRISINDYLNDKNAKDLNQREEIVNFLKYLHATFFNIILNGKDMYLLGDREEEISSKCINIIKEYLDGIRNIKIY